MGRVITTTGIVAAATVTVLCLSTASSRAEQEAGTGSQAIVTAIQTLQPAVTSERAEGLSRVFLRAGQMTEVDPLLLVAIAMRESSLSEQIERLERLGSHGERGLMQTHGVALRLRPEECTSELEGAWCQVATGARWLAFVRDQCPGSPWRWIAAYGMSRCPSEQQAGMDASTRRARTLYEQVGGAEWP